MVNPFEKRATEYLREDEAFLAVVTPEPLMTFFKEPAEEGRLYDRLVMIIGTPGSGKTTLAQLFQYSTLRTLVRNRSAQNYKPLVDSLTSCGALEDETPTIVGCRLPLESEYREIWELPYPEDLKSGLLITLLQVRAVLGWLRALKSHDDVEVTIIPRPDASAAATAIGGLEGPGVLERARAIEEAIYRVTAALVAPPLEALPIEAVSAYRPLDVIEAFQVRDGKEVHKLRPLVIFDDAHSLHPTQLSALRTWLARRELKVARWVLMRFDALRPADALGCRVVESENESEPGLNASRDITEIRLQSQEDRRGQRTAFRKMAKDMANRYLTQMEIFRRRALTNLGDLLSTVPEEISPSDLARLSKSVDSSQRRLGISNDRRRELEEEVERYLTTSTTADRGEDVRLAMVSILLNRYAKRVPQPSLFEGLLEAEPTQTPTADPKVVDGAKIHLLHHYARPYYFGMDALCDASSENAEQFLQLSSALVTRLETQLIRRRGDASLKSGVQDDLLRARAREMIESWEFPQHQLVKRLADRIAERCLKRSMEPNASLGGGASAFGILQEDFDALPTRFPELARVLQFGVAYNAFTLVPNHGTKKKTWCLIELGGVLLVRNGLTLKRGGFIESRPDELAKMLKEEQAHGS